MRLTTTNGVTYPLAPRRRLDERLYRCVSADMVAWYSGGATVREIMGTVGRSYGFVHLALTAAGCQMRRRGYAAKSAA